MYTTIWLMVVLVTVFFVCLFVCLVDVLYFSVYFLFFSAFLFVKNIVANTRPKCDYIVIIIILGWPLRLCDWNAHFCFIHFQLCAYSVWFGGGGGPIFFFNNNKQKMIHEIPPCISQYISLVWENCLYAMRFFHNNIVILHSDHLVTHAPRTSFKWSCFIHSTHARHLLFEKGINK